jgi:hypothetical protein
MTSEETAKTMLEKVKNTSGLVFVHADDWVWTFKDRKLVMSGHTINIHDLLDILEIERTEFSFEDDAAAENFSNLV